MVEVPPAHAEPIVLATVDRGDPGDETFRRFRYQATHAATLAMDLLLEGGDLEAVYCEQYEDILLRHSSGKFRGVQVKTRDDGAEAFSATDTPILEALLRFVELDLAHGAAFVGFTLATNGVFDRAGRGRGNLHTVVAEARARAADASALCPRATSLAKTIASKFKKKATQKKGSKNAQGASVVTSTVHRAAASIDQILACLARVDLRDDLPKLPDIRSRLRERLIALSSRVKASTLIAADLVVDALELAAYRAASRADEDKNGRLWFISDPATRASLAVSNEIKSKCISREVLEAAIEKHCAGSLLVGAETVRPDQIPKDLSIMEKKLVAGGLSNATLSIARDAVASVQEQGAQMYYRDGDEGLRRYTHARTVVKKECALAYETQAANEHVSGPKMLADLEHRLKQRRADDATGVLGECEEEHLLGHAFALTGECVVWWSMSRDLGATAITGATEPANGG